VDIDFSSSEYCHDNPVIQMLIMKESGFDFEPIAIEGAKTVKYYIEEGGFEPIRGHFEDAGMDLRTPIDVVVPKGGSAVIDTLVHTEIPVGYYGKLESKSGLNVKHGVVSLGGTIDSGYNGSIVVKLYNFGDKDYEFKAGDKIVQMIIQPCVLEEWIEDDDFSESERGDSGFGSTGR
jgi:dUTP pyrophosphatase